MRKLFKLPWRSSDDAHQQAQRIAAEVVRRRAQGEDLPDEQVLTEHPHLAALLRDELRKVGFIQRASAAATQEPWLKAMDRIDSDADPESWSQLHDEQDGVDDAPLPDIRMTIVESADDATATQMLGHLEPAHGFATASVPPGDEQAAGGATRRFRPSARPPMAVLCVLDDNLASGEWIRVRDARFVIGREQGNLLLPHDALVSSVHAALNRRRRRGRFRWYLQDLDSRNGTFVQAKSAQLHHDSEIVVGGHRFRFLEHAGGRSRGDGNTMNPELFQIAPDRGHTFSINTDEVWIGRDVDACEVALEGDLFADDKHCVIRREENGHWYLKDFKSLNGVWFRLPEEVPLANGCTFQVGEQRVRFYLP